MSNVVYFPSKRRKKPQSITSVKGVPVFRGEMYYEDSIKDLDCVDFIKHVAAQLPTKSKKEFTSILKKMQDFAQLVIKDGTPEIKKAMIDMGFLLTDKGDSDENR